MVTEESRQQSKLLCCFLLSLWLLYVAFLQEIGYDKKDADIPEESAPSQSKVIKRTLRKMFKQIQT